MVPKPLGEFGQRDLRSALAIWRHTPRTSLSSPQQKNCVDYENKIRGLYNAGKLALEDIVCFSVVLQNFLFVWMQQCDKRDPRVCHISIESDL